MSGSNVAPVRWQRDEPRRGRVFDDVEANKTHPAAEVPCLLCMTELRGREWQLLVLGPGADDTGAQAKYAAGGWFTADAVVVHKACLDLVADDQLGQLASEIGPEELGDPTGGQA